MKFLSLLKDGFVMCVMVFCLVDISACAGSLHLGGGSPCVTSIMSATTLVGVEAALEAMGVQKELATKTAMALMTSRLTPSQVCASLKR